MKQQNQQITLLLFGMIVATTVAIEYKSAETVYQSKEAAQDLQAILLTAMKPERIVPAHSDWALHKVHIWAEQPENQEQGSETPSNQDLTSTYFVVCCDVVTALDATFDSIRNNTEFRQHLQVSLMREKKLAGRNFTGIGLLAGYTKVPKAETPEFARFITLGFCLAEAASKATKVKKLLQESCPVFDSLSNALRKLIGKKKGTLITLPALDLKNVELTANPKGDAHVVHSGSS